MERAIVNIDLTKKEIQPQELLEKYLELLRIDIKNIFSDKSLEKINCPTSGDGEVRQSFFKMGMRYNISKLFGNIYLSPRPNGKKLLQFYKESSAREFWLKNLWSKTFRVRQEKIINPHLNWAHQFISQYLPAKELFFSEFLANHWGYYLSAKKVFPKSNYCLVDPLFDSKISVNDVSDSNLTYKIEEKSTDAVFLFEALDRSTAPFDLLNNVLYTLKPGGLCFITCLLSSGFEIKILEQKSEIFVPPERMNLLSFEGMQTLIAKLKNFDILEFSTPGVLDVNNVIKNLDNSSAFFNYIFKERNDFQLLKSFQDYFLRQTKMAFMQIQQCMGKDLWTWPLQPPL